MTKSNSISYFEREGRENWPQVLRLVKRTFLRRLDLRSCKVVIYTAIGEGPAAAYNLLQEWDPKIIAVTLPPDFSVVRDGQKVSPRIPAKAMAFFDGVQIPVIRARLPFDKIEGATAHNDQMTLITRMLSLFGGGFTYCVQAVLQACDHGLVEIGEKVIAITGDCAAVVTASTSTKFLTRDEGLAINEIICKPRNLTIARNAPAAAVEQARSLFDQAIPQLKAPAPNPRESLTVVGEVVFAAGQPKAGKKTEGA